MAARIYDLEERTFRFTQDVITLINGSQKNLTNTEIGKQLVRSAGSVGANYIEANESLSKKDFALRIKICRKEAKESTYWLRLFHCENELIKEQERLVQESKELTRIFGAILEKTKLKSEE